ncbi:MAG: hypothetical protein DMF69_09015 [Acidobacteria bacterium]|nr:MAG: hypothetical protein DMF69_09015 [Acidobacteriota bacterium]
MSGVETQLLAISRSENVGDTTGFSRVESQFLAIASSRSHFQIFGIFLILSSEKLKLHAAEAGGVFAGCLI